MGKTTIEWTDASWNPVTGCKEISPGCANCYAARLAATRLKNVPAYKGLAILRDGRLDDANSDAKYLAIRPHWIGEVRLHPDRLEEPLHWKKPRKIFVCDMSDLFHESVDFGMVSEVFSVMKHCHWHTFQVLTKRADRMRDWLSNGIIEGMVTKVEPFRSWPLPNVWLGVSVENQHFADERIPALLTTPAAVRFISAEPLLGPVDLEIAQCSCPMRIPFRGQTRHLLQCLADCRRPDDQTKWAIDWVICGGESGVNARPMHPDWARGLRDQCQAAVVPFFFKQWGQWIHISHIEGAMTGEEIDKLSMRTVCRENGPDIFFRVGKKKAGRLLDGREWNEFPQLKL